MLNMLSFIYLTTGTITHTSSYRWYNLFIQLIELTELFKTATQHKFDLHQIFYLLWICESWHQAIDYFRIDIGKGDHLLIETQFRQILSVKSGCEFINIQRFIDNFKDILRVVDRNHHFLFFDGILMIDLLLKNLLNQIFCFGCLYIN